MDVIIYFAADSLGEHIRTAAALSIGFALSIYLAIAAFKFIYRNITSTPTIN